MFSDIGNVRALSCAGNATVAAQRNDVCGIKKTARDQKDPPGAANVENYKKTNVFSNRATESSRYHFFLISRGRARGLQMTFEASFRCLFDH